MSIERHVTVQGIRLKFAAAHMATLGDELEPLHGHNYIVRCRVDGDLTDDHWVIDFSMIKQFVRDICDEIDHHFLLQTNSPLLDIQQDADGWSVTFGDRAYRFPTVDVYPLPIANTTAELLAEWIAERTVDQITTHGLSNIARIEVDVEEMPGQWGGYARELG